MNSLDIREQVRKALKQAFPLCPMEGISEALSHEECVGLRPKLISLTSEDFCKVLPRILEDVLDTHTNKPGESEDAEHIISLLDVATVSIDGNLAKERWGNGDLI